MVISVKRIKEYGKLFLLFAVCTFVFYHLISWMTDVVRPANPYEKPQGRAVKVFGAADSNQEGLDWYKDRLFYFYWYGE